jgi:toxin ParE1/3/4
MRLRWLRESISDLTKIRAYIGRDNVGAAEHVRLQIVEATRQLEHLPRLGHPGRRARTRELGVPRLPYIIAYRIDRDELVILGIFHGAQER